MKKKREEGQREMRYCHTTLPIMLPYDFGSFQGLVFSFDDDTIDRADSTEIFEGTRRNEVLRNNDFDDTCSLATGDLLL